MASQLSAFYHRRFGGRIHLQDGTRAHWIQMHAGLISGARFAGDFDPLGQILFRLGRIKRGDLRRSLEHLTRCERPQGQLLREMGLLTSREVEQALRHQLERRMSRLLALGGRVRVTSTSSPGRRPVGPCRPLHPYAAIWRHVRGLTGHEVERLLARIGDGPFRLLSGETPPFWLPGLDGAALARATEGTFTPRRLPASLRRPVLFLHEASLLDRWGRVGRQESNPAPPAAPRLPGDGSRDAIRRAYRRLALQLHPDRHPRASSAERAALAARFARVTEAYQNLIENRRSEPSGDLTAS